MPDSRDVTALLGEIPLFGGLSPGDIESLSKRAGIRSFGAEETIFSAGDAGDVLYLIASGLVRIVLPAEGHEAILVLLSAGEFFGELSLLDGEPRSASAISMGPTETFTLARTDFLGFLEECPRAALAVLATLSQRLRRSDDLIRDAIFLDTPTRLAKKLLELGETFGEARGDAVEIAIPLSDRDLAEMIGAGRETVRRNLGALEQRGVVRRQGRRFILLRREELQKAGHWRRGQAG